MSSPTLWARSRLILALLLLSGVAQFGCRADEGAVATGAPDPAAAPPSQVGTPLPAASRALRTTVEFSITVANLPEAARAFRASVEQHGGYVGEARIASGGRADNAFFEAHVPVAQLPSLRADVAKLGEVTSDFEKSEDVTEQRADIDARLRAARAQENRLLGLLAEKTGSLADVIAVDKELANVRETIERMEAQQRVLEGQIVNATVRLNLALRPTAIRPGTGGRIATAFHDGFETAGAFLVGLVVFLASAGPTMLAIAALGYPLYRAVRFFARRAARGSAPKPAGQ